MIGPSGLLAAAELRWARTAQLWRVSWADDGAGGRSSTWQQLADVDVVAGIPSPAERATAEQEGVESGYVLKVAADANVRRGDRLVLDSGAVVEVDSTVGRSSSGMSIVRGHDEPWRAPTS